MRLSGKVAVITGGTSGIGAATARLFAREGAQVVVTGRRPEPLSTVADEVDGLPVVGDLADPDHPTLVVAKTVARFGGVDIVVANAGGGTAEGSIVDVDDDGWARSLEANLNGPGRLFRAAIPSMIERGGGSIVLVSSVLGLRGTTEAVAYGTAKTALIGLMRSMAVDFGPQGVRVNALCPGWVMTPMGDRAMDWIAEERGTDRAGAYQLATAHVPLRRPATAEEIASCCLFLAGPESSIVTGAVLVADGGQNSVDLGGLLFDPDVASG